MNKRVIVGLILVSPIAFFCLWIVVALGFAMAHSCGSIWPPIIIGLIIISGVIGFALLTD